MKLSKRQLKRIIREAIESAGQNTNLEDEIVAILTIDLLGYQPEEGSSEEDGLYEIAQKIIAVCKR